MSGMAEPSWQQTLASETDAAKKEWMALERRYHAQVIEQDGDAPNKRVRLFVSLSDPELPARLKGEVELQMTLPSKYPQEPPVVDFSQWSSRLSNKQVEAVNAAVRARAHELVGSYLLRKLLTWIDNNFWRAIDPMEKDVSSEEETQDTTPNGTESPVAEAEVQDLSEKVKKLKRRRGQRPCRFFAKGTCRDGENCKFAHAKKQDKPKTDASSDASELDHTTVVREADPAQPPTPDTPQRKKKTRARRCRFFAQNKCRDGDNCKFSHELKSSKKTDQQKLEAPPRAVVVQLGAAPQSPLQPAGDSNEDVKGTASPKMDELPPEQADECEWSEAQQFALDLALKKYPASMDKKERWTSIANDVEGRSLNECIDRFKMLCDLVRRGVDPATHVASKHKKETDMKSEMGQEHTAEANLQAQNSRIISSDRRVAIETEPEAKGTQISLEDLFLHEIGTLVAQRLVCQVQCDNCPLQFDAILTLDSAEIQKWCPRCSVLHHVIMRPVFAHAQSNVLAYVDTENCSVVDVLPSDVLATCLECGSEALVERITPRQRAEQACFSCHVKLAIMAKRLVASQPTGAGGKRSSSPTGDAAKGKKGGKQVVETFVLGQPLPRNGACDHYKHSFRWFRFQCCGKAFPCDVCHDSSDCPEANLGKFASRMICGLCSKEQSSSVKVCSCGNDVAAKKAKSRHWEGGSGCRDASQMSRWDKQKYRGQNKTESKKFKRVGAEAKRRRDNANNANAEQ